MSKQVPFRQAIISQYKDIRLNSENLNELHNLRKKGRVYRIKKMSLQMLTYAILIVMIVKGWDEFTSTNRKQMVLEVLNNHSNLSNVEIQSSQFSQLANYFQRYNFTIQPLGDYLSNKWQFIGGKKCFLLNKPAAHLYVKNNDTGRIESLYQAPLKGPLNDMAFDDNQMYVKNFSDMSIKMFVRDNLFVAMTNSK